MTCGARREQRRLGRKCGVSAVLQLHCQVLAKLVQANCAYVLPLSLRQSLGSSCYKDVVLLLAAVLPPLPPPTALHAPDRCWLQALKHPPIMQALQQQVLESELLLQHLFGCREMEGWVGG